MRLLLALLLMTTAAQAHEMTAAQDWINLEGYKNDSGTHCCGPADCHTRQPNQVRIKDGKYSVKHPVSGLWVTVPKKAVYPSRDGKIHYCLPGCLFLQGVF